MDFAYVWCPWLNAYSVLEWISAAESMWGYSSVVERSLSMGEGWGSIPHTSKNFCSCALERNLDVFTWCCVGVATVMDFASQFCAILKVSCQVFSVQSWKRYFVNFGRNCFLGSVGACNVDSHAVPEVWTSLHLAACSWPAHREISLYICSNEATWSFRYTYLSNVGMSESHTLFRASNSFNASCSQSKQPALSTWF